MINKKEVKMENIISPKDYLDEAIFEDDIFNFCANYYFLFLFNQPSEETVHSNFLSLMLWNRTSEESYKIEKKFTEQQYESVRADVWKITDRILDNLISEKPNEDLFYRKLYAKIFDELLFSTDLEIICALSFLVVCPRIPYFQLFDGLKMDLDEYSAITTSIYKQISKAIFAIYYGYEQNTELASQFYEIVKELEGDKKRIVFIAQLISFYNSQIKRLIDEGDSDDSSATADSEKELSK